MSLAAAMSQLADEITRTTRDRRDALAGMRRTTTASLADYASRRREVAQRHAVAAESYLESLRDDVMSLRAAAAKELEAHAEARLGAALDILTALERDAKALHETVAEELAVLTRAREDARPAMHAAFEDHVHQTTRKVQAMRHEVGQFVAALSAANCERADRQREILVEHVRVLAARVDDWRRVLYADHQAAHLLWMNFVGGKAPAGGPAADQVQGKEAPASPEAPVHVALHEAAQLAPAPKHADMDAEMRGEA